MVTQYGMTERLGAIRYGSDNTEVFLGRDMGHQRDYSEEVAGAIDAEVARLIDAAHQEAFDVLDENRDVLDELVRQLFEHETLDKEQVARDLRAAAPPAGVRPGPGPDHAAAVDVPPIDPPPGGAARRRPSAAAAPGPPGRVRGRVRAAPAARRSGPPAGRPTGPPGTPGPPVRRRPVGRSRQPRRVPDGQPHHGQPPTPAAGPGAAPAGRPASQPPGCAAGAGRRLASEQPGGSGSGGRRAAEQTFRPPDAEPALDMAVDHARAEAAVRETADRIGEDPDRDGLRDTPARVARAYAEMFAGLDEDPAEVLATVRHRARGAGAGQGHRDVVDLRAPPAAVPGVAHVGLHPFARRHGSPG